MAAISDLSDLINRSTGGGGITPDLRFCFKLARIDGAAAPTPIAGRTLSAWRYDGFPAGGAVPTVGAIPDRTTQGALPFTAPGGGRQKWQLSQADTSTVGGTVLIYDRLFHIGDLSGASTSDQTIQGASPSPALTRNTGGLGNFAFYEIYTDIGTSSRTMTMTYTNQAGTTGRTATINIGAVGFREATRAQRIPLQAGDEGIRAVEKIAIDVSTGAAGNFGLVIAQPLALIPVGAGGLTGFRDWPRGLPGIPDVHPDACRAMLFIPFTASPLPEIWDVSSFVEA